jgi:fructose-1,6-bisphosphatase/inositol monophosphatase family enzyme
MFSKGQSTFYLEDAVVWIDPIDGTRYFVGGPNNYVTCLIGKLPKKTVGVAIE